MTNPHRESITTAMGAADRVSARGAEGVAVDLAARRTSAPPRGAAGRWEASRAVCVVALLGACSARIAAPDAPDAPLACTSLIPRGAVGCVQSADCPGADLRCCWIRDPPGDFCLGELNVRFCARPAFGFNCFEAPTRDEDASVADD